MVISDEAMFHHFFEVREEHSRSFLGKIIINEAFSGKSYIYIYIFDLSKMSTAKITNFSKLKLTFIDLSTSDRLYLIKNDLSEKIAK